MTHIPSDYHKRLERCLVSRDIDEAFALINVIKAAQAARNALGFDADLASLNEIAGGGSLGKLSKAANARKGTSGGNDAILAPDLSARLDVALRTFDNATNEIEKASAERQLRSLQSDVVGRHEIAKAFAKPRDMDFLR